MKKNLYLILFLLAVVTASAQKQGQARIDSLLKELPKQKNDSRKVSLLNSLSYDYQWVHARKGIEYGKQALRLAQKLKWDKGIATAQYNIAGNYNTLAISDTALIYATAALVTGKKLRDNVIIANSLMNISYCHILKGNYSKALEHLGQTFPYAENANDKLLMAWLRLNMGFAYLRMGRFDQSTEYFNKTWQSGKQMNNHLLMAEAEFWIGCEYNAKGNQATAMAYFKKSLATCLLYGFKELAAINYGYMGNTAWFLSDYLAAVDFLQQGINIAGETDNKSSAAWAESIMGTVYSSLSDYARAMEYYQKALKFFKSSDDKFMAFFCMSAIGDCYERMSDYPLALQWYKEALKGYTEIQSKLHYPVAYYNVGHIYYYLSDYSQSLSYLQQALQASREINNSELLSCIYSLYSGLCLHSPDSILIEMELKPLEKYRHALVYADSAVYYANETGIVEDMIPAWKLRSEIHREQGDFEQALNAYQTYISLRDSITSEETQKQVTRKQMQFEFEKKEAITKAEREKEDIRQRNVRNASFATVGGLLLFSLVVLRQRNKVKKEKKRSDTLLLNILPEEVADELKAKGSAEAKQFDGVSILFTDFVNFTQTAEKLTPQQLVGELNECFTAFDNIIERNGLEKIKTIGDAYMAVCGLPNTHPRHAQKTVQAALEIRDFIEERRKSERVFEIRIGIHTGSVVAGIVGVKKFAYDIWGDTVNTAARMESSGEPGKVNISDTTYELVKEDFNCTYRGKIEAKGKGEVDMYFVETI